MGELTELLGGGSAGQVLRALHEGVWRRSTGETVFGLEALTVKARGAEAARAGGLASWYGAVHAAAAEQGVEAVKAAAAEVLAGSTFATFDLAHAAERLLRAATGQAHGIGGGEGEFSLIRFSATRTADGGATITFGA